VQGQAQEQGTLPQGSLPTSYFIRSCSSASGGLPLLRYTCTDTVVKELFKNKQNATLLAVSIITAAGGLC